MVNLKAGKKPKKGGESAPISWAFSRDARKEKKKHYRPKLRLGHLSTIGPWLFEGRGGQREEESRKKKKRRPYLLERKLHLLTRGWGESTNAETSNFCLYAPPKSRIKIREGGELKVSL